MLYEVITVLPRPGHGGGRDPDPLLRAVPEPEELLLPRPERRDPGLRGEVTALIGLTAKISVLTRR